MALSECALELLRDTTVLGGYGVHAELICPAAELVNAGYARAEDDYEGPRLYITDKGRRAAIRRKFIKV